MTETSTSPQAHSRLLLRVLVADGVASVNESLTALLSDLEGIAVCSCVQEPAKVVALVETMQPDVVLLDLHAPGTSGTQTLRQLKQPPCAPVVIVLSHYALPPLREACLSAGADYFFEKTAELEHLRGVLNGLAQTGQGADRQQDCQLQAERPMRPISALTPRTCHAPRSPNLFAYD